MGFSNLLATKWGRLTTFFCLYLTEGIPQGFTSVAIAAQMRIEGVPPAQIGAFIASLYLPWSWKWAMGPFVDVFSSEKWGRRRMWIVVAQCLMVVTLMSGLNIDFSTQLKLFTALILVHNVFAATQDVAIDALACDILQEEERGLGNGLMFAGRLPRTRRWWFGRIVSQRCVWLQGSVLFRGRFDIADHRVGFPAAEGNAR